MRVLRLTVAAGFSIAFLGLLLTSCSQPVEPADLVLRKGRVVTVDALTPEASAVAVRGDRIVAVGSDSEIEPFIGDATRIIELEGQLAIPGFIEGHGHFAGIGQAQLVLPLAEAASWDEIVSMVKAKADEIEPGEWILGRGWHQEKWTSTPEPNVDGVPLHHQLSRVSPHNPVLLTHASGHAGFANAKAIELAGIDDRTLDPAGGEIIRDRQGRATGLLRETAQRLVRQVLRQHRSQRSPEQIEAERRRVMELAARECLSNGITSFQDAGSSFETVDLLKKLLEEGKLPLRLWVMLRESNERLAESIDRYRLVNLGDHRLTVRAIKASIDGALGSHGAWLLQPYSDLPGSSGLNTTSIESLRQTAGLAIEHGFQFCVHAIGDRGNRETLNIFSEVFALHPEKQDLRWRVEHAQHISPEDIPRFAELDVIASMQGIHCTSDGPWVEERLGPERTQAGSYVWQSLLAGGAVVTNGTDAPVEDVSPIASYYASISRRLEDGSVFIPEQRMSRMDALRSYTLNAAYAAFEDEFKGSLSVGKLADIAVLDRDILTIEEEAISDTRVVMTIVGGQVEFQRSADGTPEFRSAQP